ncbi:MAG: 4-phosphopantetheinyl transferase superfamily protein [Chitinophagaceae bacterium]|nr:4-phosphopantetheinyl transferase superfamily protein [Chitinophagaceae bacterium]
MPVFYEHINGFAKIAIWHIAEEKKFFLEKVPLQREITHPHKQLQHLAGRYLLQHLYPDFPYHLIEIADTKKPFLPNEEYHFSISHCGDYAAVIVSKNHRVGIDIELVSPKVERIKHKFLNEEELNAVGNRQSAIDNHQSTNQPINQLTLLWCCKEAVFKWYGNGGVDFKENIHLQPSVLNMEEGIINCEFVKEGKIPLEIQYKYFDGLCLAWVVS